MSDLLSARRGVERSYDLQFTHRGRSAGAAIHAGSPSRYDSRLRECTLSGPLRTGLAFEWIFSGDRAIGCRHGSNRYPGFAGRALAAADDGRVSARLALPCSGRVRRVTYEGHECLLRCHALPPFLSPRNEARRPAHPPKGSRSQQAAHPVRATQPPRSDLPRSRRFLNRVRMFNSCRGHYEGASGVDGRVPPSRCPASAPA